MDLQRIGEMTPDVSLMASAQQRAELGVAATQLYEGLVQGTLNLKGVEWREGTAIIPRPTSWHNRLFGSSPEVRVGREADGSVTVASALIDSSEPDGHLNYTQLRRTATVTWSTSAVPDVAVRTDRVRVLSGRNNLRVDGNDDVVIEEAYLGALDAGPLTATKGDVFLSLCQTLLEEGRRPAARRERGSRQSVVGRFLAALVRPVGH